MFHAFALPEGSRLVDDYEIEHVLGAGGFGITYLAREIALDRKVTVKEYFPSDFAARGAQHLAEPRSENAIPDYDWGLSRFIDEAKTLARFDHPNIVRVYRYFQANNTAYMVLQFEEGRSLKDWLKGLGRTPRQGELDAIIAPLLDALSTLHAANFLHRDIAPDNIIIRADGQPVLIDFGSARGDIAFQTRTVSALVKPGYSPYEQYGQDGKQQGPWTDIYALAATLYHAVTGKRPPDAPSRIVRDELVSAHTGALGSFRSRFLSAIDRALSLDIETRPQSIAAWRGDLLADEPKAQTGWFGARAKAVEHNAAPAGRQRRPAPASDPARDPIPYAPPPPDAPDRQGGFIAFLERMRQPTAPRTAMRRQSAVAGEADVISRPPAEAKASVDADNPGDTVQRDRAELPAPAAGGGLFSALRKARANRSASRNESQAEDAKAIADAHHEAGFDAAAAEPGAVGAPVVARAAAPAGNKIARAAAPRARRAWFWPSFARAVGAAPAPVAPKPAPLEKAGGAVVKAKPARRPPKPRVRWTIPWRGFAFKFALGVAIAAAAVSIQRSLPKDLFAGAQSDQGGPRAASTDRRPTSYLVRQFQPHVGGTDHVAIANGGRWLVTAGGDRTLKIFEAGTETRVRTIGLGRGQATALAVAGTRALTGHETGHIVLWDLQSGQALATFQRNEARIWSLAFVPGDGTFAAAAHDWSVVFWAIASPDRPAHVFEGHDNAVQVVAASAGGARLASGSADKTVKLWDRPRLSLVRTYRGHRDFVTALAFSPDGRRIASGALDGEIRVWSTRSRSRIRRLRGHDGEVTHVAYLGSTRWLASAGVDGVLRVWDVARGRTVQSYGSAGQKVVSMAAEADKGRITTATDDGWVRIWDVSRAVN